MVLIIVNYTKPLEDIKKLLPEHIKFTKNACKEGKFIFNGPRKTHTGGIGIVNTSLEEAQEIIKGSPFYLNQAAEHEFIEFDMLSWDDRFSCFINK